MFWFKAGIVVNCIVIAGVIINAVYDALTLKHGTSHNAWVNLIGFIIAVIVIVAFNLKNTGNLKAANTLLWIPGAPASLMLVFFLIMIVVSSFSDSGWR